jgi:predicted  nucleic acid-binding Zn-ribbon protein
MTAKRVPGARAAEPIEYQWVDEDPHSCGHCGARTDLDDAGYYASGTLRHDCPDCGQRYVLEESDDDAVPLEAEGEIEIVDERTGQVVGMTSEPDAPAVDSVLADLAPSGMPEASQEDLDHLFGVKPSPYGDAFGSFG